MQNHYVHILELLLRLRQCCDHPLIVLMCTTMAHNTRKPTLKYLKTEYDRTFSMIKMRHQQKLSQGQEFVGSVEEHGNMTASPQRTLSCLNIGLPILENLFTPEKNVGKHENKDGVQGVCPLCLDGFEDDVIETPCSHRFCKVPFLPKF